MPTKCKEALCYTLPRYENHKSKLKVQRGGTLIPRHIKSFLQYFFYQYKSLEATPTENMIQ